MKYVLIAIASVIFLSYCGSASKKCDCDNVNDCLSKYKFEEARKYAASEKDWEKPGLLSRIIVSEAQYWNSQKEFNKAFILSKELAQLKIENSLDFNETERNESYFKLLSEIITAKSFSNDTTDINEIFSGFDIIDESNNTYKKNCYYQIIRKYCKDGELIRAKEFVQNMPEKITIETTERISSGFSNNSPEDILICRKKYNATKNGLKSNQEIEPFKETSGDDYKITTYEYPRIEALKIIEEYKK